MHRHRARALCRHPTLRPTSRRTAPTGSPRSTARGARKAWATWTCRRRPSTPCRLDRAGLRGRQPRARRTRGELGRSAPSRLTTRRGVRRVAPTPAPTPALPTAVDRRLPGHLRRLDLGRRPDSSVLEADYYWMYDDGCGGKRPPPPTRPAARRRPAGCWGHRERRSCTSTPDCPSRPDQVLSMGAGLLALGPLRADRIAAVLRQLVRRRRPTSTVTAGASSPPNGGQSRHADGRRRAHAGQRHRRYREAQAQRHRRRLRLRPRTTGSLSRARPANSPIVGMAATPDGRGVSGWSASDGGIFSFRRRCRSTAVRRRPPPQPAHRRHGLHARRQVATWLVATDGGIFSYGDARLLRLHRWQATSTSPSSGIAADPATGGYWRGRRRRRRLQLRRPLLRQHREPSTSTSPSSAWRRSPNGQGYRFVAADGGIFTYGQAPFDGSTGGPESMPAPVVRLWPPTMPPTGTGWRRPTAASSHFGGATYFGRVVSTSG